jgi:hypothetical protein
VVQFCSCLWQTGSWGRRRFRNPDEGEYPSLGASTQQRLMKILAYCQSQSYITTGSQSAIPSWCQALIWDPRPILPLLSLIIFRQLRVCWCGAPSLTRSRICNLQCNDASSISSYIATDGLSARSSWFRAPNGENDQLLISLFDNYERSNVFCSDLWSLVTSCEH